ncbi:MAG: alpha/beta fold hydrolase [Candidatus Hydrogenedentes bacterium]|nr:alpha/beta fold hydrolase [Candidatus Hydrogenedentota bacterium]
MHIEPYGTGSTAYLAIHGWAGSHRTFRHLAPHLPADAALYSVDLPGYGLSLRPVAWTLDSVADALVDTINLVSNAPITLIGYCGGGNLAMMAARRAPERVARLVLIDPFAYMPLYFKVFTWGEFGRRAYYSTFANPLGRYFTNAALRGKRTANSNLTQSFESVDHEFVLDVLRAFRAVPHWDSFSDLTLPVDLAHGDRSFAAIKKSVAIWKAVWPHAQVHPLAGAGHNPLIEAAEQVAAIAFGIPATHGSKTLADTPRDTVARRALSL